MSTSDSDSAEETQQTMFNQMIFAVRVVRHDKTSTSKPEALALDVWMVSGATKFKCRTLSHTPLTHLRCFQTFRLIFSGTMTATRLVGGTAN